MVRRALSAALLGVLLATPPLGVVRAQESDPSRSIFFLETLSRIRNAQGRYNAVEYGTAFLVGSDGTALTASHVVYRAQHDPDRYALVAMVDKELYSVSVVCAARLPYDVTLRPVDGVQISRDVAEIKLLPYDGPLKRGLIFAYQGETYTLATLHKGPLPRFPALRFGPEPRAGASVRVLGYGHISPLPEAWVATGEIQKSWTAQDGTRIFTIAFSNPAQPGNSGSPVLNDQNQVIGMWAWYNIRIPTMGSMMGASALEPACP